MGGFWGKKNLEKCSPLSHNVQKQLDWDFMECANLGTRLFGANKRNNCQCSRTAKTSGDPRIWRFIGGLAFLSGARSRQEALDRKCQLAPKTAHGIPPIFGRRGKSAGFSPLTFHLLECGGRRGGGRVDCMEKGRILERKLWNPAAEGTFSQTG